MARDTAPGGDLMGHLGTMDYMGIMDNGGMMDHMGTMDYMGIMDNGGMMDHMGTMDNVGIMDNVDHPGPMDVMDSMDRSACSLTTGLSMPSTPRRIRGRYLATSPGSIRARFSMTLMAS